MSAVEKKAGAMSYLQSQGLGKTVETMINQVCRDKPANAIDGMIQYLQTLASTPSIERLHAFETLSSNGLPTIQVDVWAAVTGVSTLLEGSIAPFYGPPVDGDTCLVPLVDVDRAWHLRNGLVAAVKNINSLLTTLIQGKNPLIQSEIDTILWESDSSESKASVGANAIFAASIAILHAGASIKRIPVFRHVASLLSQGPTTITEPLSLPSPVVLIFSPRAAGGKLKLRGIHLTIPNRLSIRQGLQNIVVTQRVIQEMVAKKWGAQFAFVNSEGGMQPPIDKLDSVIDLISEAATSCGLRLGVDVFLYLDYGGAQVFEPSKNKYEMVQSQFRSAEDFANEIAELVTSKPEILVIQDPFRVEDSTACSILRSKLPEYCSLTTTNHSEITGKFVFIYASAVVCVSKFGTVSRFLDATRGKGRGLVVETQAFAESGWVDVADLAVAIRAGYLKAGGATRERTAVYNRLLQIEAQLERTGDLVVSVIESVLPTPQRRGGSAATSPLAQRKNAPGSPLPNKRHGGKTSAN